MTRYLIINADDFGLSEAVSRGILKAHREGVLTSTTFMVNFPWAQEMAPLLREAPDLGVGVHLNLTTGKPLLPPAEVPSLVTEEGRFSKALFHLLVRVNLEEAHREWHAQIEKGIALLGRLPTHLDTHRYLQGIPGYATIMVELAREFGIPAVRHLHPGMVPQRMLARLSPLGMLRERYLRKAADIVKASGLRHPRTILAGDFDKALLLTRLEQVGDGVTELVSHPGEVDDLLRSLSSMQDHRLEELAALIDPDIRQKIETESIRLVTFAHLVS